MDTEKKIKVLVAEDEREIRDFLTGALGPWPAEVKAVADGWEAVEAAKQEKFDLVFLDIRMPKMDGLRAFIEIKKIMPDFVNCVFVSSYNIEADLLEFVKQNNAIILKKPFEDARQIEAILRDVLGRVINPAAEKHCAERRAFVRLDMGLEVNYKVKDREGYRHSLSKNIIFGGIELFMPEWLKPSTVLELEIRFPKDGKIIKAGAEVIWSRKSLEKIDYFNTGIKFLDIDQTELAIMLLRSSHFCMG